MRIRIVVVKLFGPVGIADISEAFISHRGKALPIGGQCRALPLSFGIFKQGPQRLAFELVGSRLEAAVVR